MHLHGNKNNWLWHAWLLLDFGTMTSFPHNLLLINNLLLWPETMIELLVNMSASASLLNNAFILWSLRVCGFLQNRGNSTHHVTYQNGTRQFYGQRTLQKFLISEFTLCMLDFSVLDALIWPYSLTYIKCSIIECHLKEPLCF